MTRNKMKYLLIGLLFSACICKKPLIVKEGHNLFDDTCGVGSFYNEEEINDGRVGIGYDSIVNIPITKVKTLPKYLKDTIIAGYGGYFKPSDIRLEKWDTTIDLFGVTVKNIGELLPATDLSGKAQKLTDSAYAVIEGILKTGCILDSFNTTYDTIPVIMLVGDTTHKFETYFKVAPCKDTNSMYICGEEVTDDLGRRSWGNVYYIFGYSVGQWKSGKHPTPDSWCPICPDYREHIVYLDDKKNKLNSSLIVWQSKEINKQ